eukprot:9213261-Pyramimonas_sp.AAC.1
MVGAGGGRGCRATHGLAVIDARMEHSRFVRRAVSHQVKRVAVAAGIPGQDQAAPAQAVGQPATP